MQIKHISQWDVLEILEEEGAPLGHVDIAVRLAKPAFRVAMVMANLNRMGWVTCLKRSNGGRNATQSIWNLTEKYYATRQIKN